MRKKDKKKKKPNINLTTYLSPEMVKSDPNGSYTGVPYETFFEGELEEPIQDADDL